MLNLLHDEFGSSSDTVLARREYGAATAVPRDEAPRPARRRTLAALTEALASTRRGFGD